MSLTQRHKTIISLVGASLVFGTFLARDRVETRFMRYRESVSAVDNAIIAKMTARTVYSEVSELKNDVNEMKVKKYSDEVKAVAKKPPMRILDEDEQELNQMRDELLYLDVVDREIVRLETTAQDFGTIALPWPDHPHTKVDVQELWPKWSEADLKRRGLWNIFSNTTLPLDRFSELQTSISSLDMTISHMTNSVNDHLVDTLLRLELIRGAVENKYLWWQSRFLIMFGIGWLILATGLLLGHSTRSNTSATVLGSAASTQEPSSAEAPTAV